MHTHRTNIRKVTRKIWRSDWDQFVKSVKRVKTGTTNKPFKIANKLQFQVNDGLKANSLSKDG